MGACSTTSLTPSVGPPLPVAHPSVSRPHSKHSRYSRSGVRRIQSSWPMRQHFNDSRRKRKVTCGTCVRTAPATAARTVVFSTRERTSRGLQPHETDQAGSGFNNDSVARVEADVSPVRRTISSATDVTYAASVELLNFPSRLDLAPSKPACKSATPS